MIKVFTLNKNGKIELTKKQLEQLLNESYWEGYNRGNNSRWWTYTSPSVITTPLTTATIQADSHNPYTINSSDISNNSITIKTNTANTIKTEDLKYEI